jgi:hypothetical protein
MADMGWLGKPILGRWGRSPGIVQKAVFDRSRGSQHFSETLDGPNHHRPGDRPGYNHSTVRDIPFSQRCLRRLPSFPFSRASRLFRLSRWSGSRRRKLTVGTFGVSSRTWPRILTLGTMLLPATGTGSSRGIDRETDDPRIVPRTVADADAEVFAGAESVIVNPSKDALACSVQAEMAWACCSDRFPLTSACDGKLGWIAMLGKTRGDSRTRLIAVGSLGRASDRTSCVAMSIRVIRISSMAV